MNPAEQIPPPAYFGSLTIENVKCFKGKHEIDLSDRNGKPAMWTVILGNNNTGKTTLLRCLADLEPKFRNDLEKPGYSPKISFKSNASLDFTVKCIWMIGRAPLKWEYSKSKSGILLVKIEKDNSPVSQIPLTNSTHNSVVCDKRIENAVIYGYGTSRRMGNAALSETENQDNTESLFNDNVTLTNSEEWLLQTYFAEKLDKPNAKETLARIKEVLISGILPDVQDFRFDTTPDFKGFVEIKTDYGWIKLRELGYGYQVTLAWIVDLAKKLFERYPNSENPLHEPAIVLIDEIDLHLHPEWQRKIIKFLSDQFPKTQFIVTTHSPVCVQSAENINLVVLEKEDDHVVIKQPDLKTYKGWTVEEILSDLMGLDGKTKSEYYYSLLADFNKALLKDDYNDAKKIYDDLDKLLNKNNPYRELLDLQLNALSVPEIA